MENGQLLRQPQDVRRAQSMSLDADGEGGTKKSLHKGHVGIIFQMKTGAPDIFDKTLPQGAQAIRQVYQS
jgi:hypothetical protein